MNSYKSHIVSLLCLIFAFPQINNAVHYFWLEHTFRYSAEKSVVFGEKHNSHDCELHLFKVPSITAITFLSFTPFVPALYRVKSFKLLQQYGFQTLTNRFLRGPPTLIFTARQHNMTK